jgi:hypothetical protein
LQAPWRIAAGESDYSLLQDNVQRHFQGFEGLMDEGSLQQLEDIVNVQFQDMGLQIWVKPRLFWRCLQGQA